MGRLGRDDKRHPDLPDDRRPDTDHAGEGHVGVLGEYILDL
jgi:hypothetical protein